jgi:hypothetical protein
VAPVHARATSSSVATWASRVARFLCASVVWGHLKCEIVDTWSIPMRLTCRSLRPMTTSGMPLHKEVLQWFAECTRELGIAPLTPIS